MFDMEKIKIRQSNFELLRIICMFGVLTNHTLQNLYDLHTPSFSIDNELRVLIMNVSILAVNCFVMISGYFQIKQSWKGFVSLVAPCFVWALVFSVISFLNGEMSVVECARRVLFPLTGGDGLLWFMVAYFALYLISPLLNEAINNMNTKKLSTICLMVLIIDVYIGYMHQAKEVTIDGYHFVHFMALYVVASYIKRKPFKVNLFRGGFVFVGLVLLMTILHMCKMVFFPISIIYAMRYNSPMMWVASIFVFIWFTNLNLQNNFINKIATSVLAVYLISSQPFVSNRLYHWFESIKDTLSDVAAFGLVFFAMLLFYIVAVMLEFLRKKMFEKLEFKISNCCQRLSEKIILFKE